MRKSLKSMNPTNPRIQFTHGFLGPGYLSRYSDWLRAGRSADRIPVWDETFRTRPGRPWGSPSILYLGYRVFPRDQAAGACCWPPTTSSAEVKKEYIYTSNPSGPSGLLLGTFTFTFTFYHDLFINVILTCEIWSSLTIILMNIQVKMAAVTHSFRVIILYYSVRVRTEIKHISQAQLLLYDFTPQCYVCLFQSNSTSFITLVFSHYV
jgi:hypothetical protein